MNRNALPSSKKTHSEKHKAILKSLLKEGSNKTCADCKTAVHPRWASWSLGCFVCIRCSGIHRSMGTHISKVKSVDLDAWTDEQVENMLRWGNDKCNLYWEAKLPEGYIPDGLKIENFIRTKYDMKKWVASSQIPNPSTLSVDQTLTRAPAPGASAAPTPRSSHSPAVAHNKSSASVPIKQKPSNNLLDDDFGTFTSSVSSSPKPAGTPTIGKLPSNDSFKQPGNGGGQSAQSTGGSLNNNSNNTNNGRPDLKKSILSLYSSPSSSSSSIIQPQQQRQQQQQQPSYLSHSSVNSITNSLSGLNFTSNTKSSPVIQHQQQHQQQQTQKPVVQNSWNNEWSESRDSSSPGNWTSTPTTQPMTNSTYSGSNTTLDDDLFKNVWG